ncbi:MAG: exonuclease SbcCD subunit D [Actinomycetota bacterium]|nr:exonuclease SbcCD subunit D [Actinomycetota bacterium]
MNSVRILHFADLHLGMENYGKIDSATGLNQRILDFLKSFSTCVDYALENDIALVIFAGDAYRTKNPSPTLQREFAKQIRRLTRAGIKVLLLVGNHDVPNTEKHAHSLAVFDALEVEGVIVARDSRVHIIDTHQGRVQVATLPHFPKSQLLKLDEYKDKTVEEINQIMAKEIESVVDHLATEVRKNSEIPSILAAHISVSTAKLGSEQSIMVGNDLTISPSALLKDEWDYIALGHIHRHQVLEESPLMVYSGSIERIDFGEEKEDKGFCVIDLPRFHRGRSKNGATPACRQTRYKFEKTPAREFLSLDIQCLTTNPTLEVLRLIAEHNVKDTVIRVMIKVPPHLRHLVQRDEILKSLSSAHYIAYVDVESLGENVRTRNPNLTESAGPLVALEEYILSREELKERRDELLKFAGELIGELQQVRNVP